MRRLTSPVVHLVVLYALALGAALLAGAPGGIAAMAAMTIFAVVNPLVVAFGESWWISTLIAAMGFGVLFAALGATPAVRAMREGATIFVLPAMVYLAAVPLSGLIRGWRWMAARGRRSAGA